MSKYEVTGRIKDLTYDYFSKSAILSLSINEISVKQMYDELQDCEKLSITVSKFREKRSLDANGFFWTLADKLAAKLNITKEEVYKNAIKHIGGVSETVCVQNKAVERLCDGWRKNGIGWQTDTFPSKLDGCTNVILYYGSSTYDKAQMSRLIDNIVQDCEAVGIETKTPDEIAKMLSLWGENNG